MPYSFTPYGFSALVVSWSTANSYRVQSELQGIWHLQRLAVIEQSTFVTGDCDGAGIEEAGDRPLVCKNDVSGVIAEADVPCNGKSLLFNHSDRIRGTVAFHPPTDAWVTAREAQSEDEEEVLIRAS